MGLISPQQISDGTTIDAADVNTPINTIANEFNGNIDSDNLAANAVGTSEIADGAVTYAKLETPVGFSATVGSNQSINNTTDTKVNFDTENFDYGSDFDATTNYDFTAPYDGLYQFNLTIYWQNIDDTNYGEIRIDSDTANTLTTYRARNYSYKVNDDFSTSVSGVLELTAGDKVWAEVYHDNGDNTPIVTGNTLTSFSGFLVGRTD